MIGWFFIVPMMLFSLSMLFFWLFIRGTGTFFVAKPREWTPDRHHQTKQGIPTMGGLMLITVWIGCMWAMRGISWQQIPALLIVLSMGTLGAYDDWSKIQQKGGISARSKFILQHIAAFIAVAVWYWGEPGAGYLWIPIIDYSLLLGPAMFLWGTFIMVATSNAINLTDGLDGLAGTVLVICFSTIALCAYNLHQGDVIYSALALVGSFIGFLWFNRYPARVFMGDTGALAFGALLGLYAVQLNITLLLPCIAIVPMVETMSVMLQVGWYKLYRTRIFKMAPLHHHFELIGYSENKIVSIAAVATIIGCMIALFSI